MFKSKVNATKVDPNTTDTIIGEGSSFEGNIKSDAGLRVEGQIKGDIECQGDVTIGEKGLVHSNITARNIIIAGTVHGNVHATNKLSINAKGKLYGDIVTHTLCIEEGSIFEGTSKMENITETNGNSNVNANAKTTSEASSSTSNNNNVTSTSKAKANN
jgi:cytoskeletal protein CcmA (bactofilin family)